MKKASVFFTVFILLTGSISQLSAQPVEMSVEEAQRSRSDFVAYSKRFIGCPYQLGAIGPDSFDCSGLIFTCARESIGVQLPRKTAAMFTFCSEVSDSEVEPGDLVFFKTTASADVSHVGVYLGNGQFIHAASDGPNTGVIISSLRENYWKTHYFATKRFLPATATGETAFPQSAKADSASIKELQEQNSAKATGTAKAGKTSKTGKSAKTKSASAKKSGHANSFLSSVIVDASLFADWNFYTSKNIRLNFRGVSSMIHARSVGKNWQPGLGMFIRYDTDTGVFQIPLITSLSFGETVRIYTGPVISFGSPSLPGESSTKIQASFFPGIMGICWQTPTLVTGKSLSFSLVQDIHYTVYNRTNGAALSPVNSIASGLVFSTGIRLELPLKNVL